MLSARISKLYHDATEQNQSNILSLLPTGSRLKLLDLGCDDGVWTKTMAERVGTSDIHGVEIVSEQAAKARALGVQVHVGDICNGLPYEDASFDIVHSNQVIEHVPSIDTFAAEIYRVLRPGGVAVISTENASSWHNIAASVLGWQMFSLTNMSGLRGGIGNPLALHRDAAVQFTSWTHKVIFGYRGLQEFFEAHGFSQCRIRGAGYHPLPASLGRLDVRHAHFLALCAVKA